MRLKTILSFLLVSYFLLLNTQSAHSQCEIVLEAISIPDPVCTNVTTEPLVVTCIGDCADSDGENFINSHEMYALSANGLYGVEPSDGSRTFLFETDYSGLASGVEMYNHAYLLGLQGDDIVSISLTNGEVNILGPNDDMDGIAVNPITKEVYGYKSDPGEDEIITYRIDLEFEGEGPCAKPISSEIITLNVITDSTVCGSIEISDMIFTQDGSAFVLPETDIGHKLYAFDTQTGIIDCSDSHLIGSHPQADLFDFVLSIGSNYTENGLIYGYYAYEVTEFIGGETIVTLELFYFTLNFLASSNPSFQSVEGAQSSTFPSTLIPPIVSDVLWYNQPTGGEIIATGSSFLPFGTEAEEGPYNVFQPGNYTYYASCNEDPSCPRIAFQFEILSDFIDSQSASPTICEDLGDNDQHILEATCSEGAPGWYNTETGGTPLFTGEIFDPTGHESEEGIPFSNDTFGAFTYYLQCGSSDVCRETKVINNIPIESQVGDLTYLGGSDIEGQYFEPICGTLIQFWYNQPIGGNVIAVGAFNPLTAGIDAEEGPVDINNFGATYTFYVACQQGEDNTCERVPMILTIECFNELPIEESFENGGTYWFVNEGAIVENSDLQFAPAEASDGDFFVECRYAQGPSYLGYFDEFFDLEIASGCCVVGDHPLLLSFDYSNHVGLSIDVLVSDNGDLFTYELDLEPTEQGEWSQALILLDEHVNTEIQITLDYSEIVLDGTHETIFLDNISLKEQLSCDEFNSNDLEEDLGIWIDGGADAALSGKAEFANSGSHSILIKDNTSTSVVTTETQDFSSVAELNLSFNFVSTGFNNSNQDFWLQLSTDGGASFETVEDWVFTEDFENGVRVFEDLNISGPFTDQTQLRFRCDATGNNDKVYLDDIVISTCGFNSEPACFEESNDFESGLGVWIDGGDDAALSSRLEFANSGSHSILLKDNTETSLVTSSSFDLVSVDELVLDFNYITTGFNNSNQDFWFQVSLDGGATFTTIEDWVYTEDFENEIREFVTVAVPGPFTDQTQFRLRCDATGNNDKVYIDDLVISECLSAPIIEEAIVETRSVVDNDVKIYPNPISIGSELLIEMTQAGQYEQFHLNTINGQFLMSQDLDERARSFNINTDGLEPGIYLLHLSGDDAQLTRKLMVMR